MHPGTADQCGEDCRSFTLNWREGQREGGGGWGGALTVRPSLVHTFRRSYVEQNKRTPLKDTGVWITTPRLDSSLVPASAASRLRFLFPVDFLFISAHPAYAVFVLQPTPPSLSLLLRFPSSSVAALILRFPPVPLVRPLLSAFPRLFCFSFASCRRLRRTRGRAPYVSIVVDSLRHGRGFIYIFLALSWSSLLLLLIILLLWNDLKQEGRGHSRHGTALRSGDAAKEKKSLPPPLPSLFIRPPPHTRHFVPPPPTARPPLCSSAVPVAPPPHR